MNFQPISTNSELTKRERLEVRLPKRLKLLLIQAAELQGRSLSDFLTSTAERAAHEVIRENQILQLTVEDSRSFAKAILSVSKPNSKLKDTYSKYKQNVTSQ